MLNLITGTPGSGKTLFAVSKILEYVEENKKLLEAGKEPRIIYADIDGLNIDGVEKAPDDWRTTPDGSIIFYDEIQQREEFKKSRFDNQIVDDLQVHRHTGHDIYGITQFPQLLHPNFRAVVGMHYHLHRGWGLSAATVFLWAYCVDNPNAPSNKKLAEHQFRFNYPKSIYKYYKSASQHTHKARIPKKMFLLIGVILILGYFAFNMLFVKDNYFKSLQTSQDSTATTLVESPTATGAQTAVGAEVDAPQLEQTRKVELENRRIYLYQTDLPKDYEIRRSDPALQVRGVIQSKGKCTAYNAYGDMMTLSQNDCKEYVGTGRVYRSSFESTPAPAVAPTPPS